ncbi:hypothetical protein SEUCBS140593_001518 [Sporothrix eucalyptigena]|uniref:Major facilitator superfamily (MFS) profile domain-containing protein n=1 Tax=Sporothrix eucalyptigena TaxID=1812306 RepID=A0ABP0AYV8_9PEZI
MCTAKDEPQEEGGNHLARVATQSAKTTWLQNKRCVFICFLVSVSSFQYGLDLSIINAQQAIVGFLKVFGYRAPSLATGWGIDTWFQQTISSMMNVGVITGSILLQPTAQHLGRRRSFWVAALICVVGNTILITTTNAGAFIFGRLVFGTSNGLFTGLGIIYISEAAPSHLRGSLISFAQLSACIGSVVGTCVNNATKLKDSRLSYQIPLFCLYGVPLLFFVLPFFIPESPRWLVLQNRPDDARTHLQRLRGPDFPPAVIDAELQAIQDAVAVEQQLALGKRKAVQMAWSVRERTRTLLTCACLTFHAASGFPFLAAYSTYFFQIAGSTDAFVDSIMVSSISVFGALVGVFLNRWVGRRPMNLVAFGSQAVLMLIIGVVWSVIPGTQTAGKIVVGLCIVFQCGYSAFCGPVAFICAGEIPSNQLRAVTYGMGSAIGFIFAFVISLTTPYFINPTALNIGPKIGYIWFASNAITFFFVLFFLPETSRRSLEDLDEMFYNKVPLRKFGQYRSHGLDLEQHEKADTVVEMVETVNSTTRE